MFVPWASRRRPCLKEAVGAFVEPKVYLTAKWVPEQLVCDALGRRWRTCFVTDSRRFQR